MEKSLLFFLTLCCARMQAAGSSIAKSKVDTQAIEQCGFEPRGSASLQISVFCLQVLQSWI